MCIWWVPLTGTLRDVYLAGNILVGTMAIFLRGGPSFRELFFVFGRWPELQALKIQSTTATTSEVLQVLPTLESGLKSDSHI